MAVSKVQPKVTFTTPVQAPKGALKTSAAKKEVSTATPSAAKTVAKYAVAALAVSAAAYGASVGYRAYTAVPETVTSKLVGLAADAASSVKDAAISIWNFAAARPVVSSSTVGSATLAVYGLVKMCRPGPAAQLAEIAHGQAQREAVRFVFENPALARLVQHLIR